jgi:hypothetical protein
MKLRFQHRRRNPRSGQRSIPLFAPGFTLLEVIVACAIFFMFAFAVLELVTRGLAAARTLENHDADPGLVAAMATLPVQLEEAENSGDFEDLFPGVYPDYRWLASTNEFRSNGLFIVEIGVYRDNRKKGVAAQDMSILLFRPNSKPGHLSKGGMGLK